jgi:hypothetical protein
MSAFETFVQGELPLRPFAASDGNAESIPVRRGQGPRQMTFIDLTDGQVLARVNGELQGVTLSGMAGNGKLGGVRYMVVDVPELSAASSWTVTHNLGSQNCVVQTYKTGAAGTLLSVIPDSVELSADGNTATISFSVPLSGKAVLSFVD